jgi:hypothetical protein
MRASKQQGKDGWNECERKQPSGISWYIVVAEKVKTWFDG